MKSIAQMQTEVWEANVEAGWAGEGSPPVSFLEAMMLLTTEVVEAVEAYRNWGMKDATGLDVHEGRCDLAFAPCRCAPKKAKPEGVGSEVADILIRLLDDCERFGIDLEAEYERKMAFNRTRSFRHGGKKI